MNNCPKCNTSWIGEEIPEDIRHYYSATHWRREIGVDGGRLGIYDGLVAIRCPDCGEDFPRNDTSWALEMFNKYKKVMSDADEKK